VNLAETPAAERGRLQALMAYEILDTPREAVFDAFVHIAADMCGVRMAGIAFIDSEREWFKARTGIGCRSVPRASSLGQAAIEHGDLLEIHDAASDERFKNALLAAQDPHVRFYAAVPLRSPQGHCIGTFCVMSRRPHSLTEQQRSGLRELALAVMQALEARRELRMLFAQSAAAHEQISLLLSAIDVAGDVVLVYRVDAQSGDLVLAYMNEAYTRQTGYTREEALERPLHQLRHAMPDDPGMHRLRGAIAHGQATQMEIVSYRKDGSSFWKQVTLHPVRSATGEITHWITVERDVSEAVEREKKLEDQHARLLLLTSAARRLFGALDYRTLVARLEEAVRELIGATVVVYKVVPDGRTIGGDALAARAARTRGHIADESRFRAAVAAGTADHVSHVLEVRAASGRTLRSGDLFILDLLGEYFGVAVRNASLVRELEERRNAILELNQVKSDLIAMLAHDFKSPLTSIVGFTELAMELGEINADQREYLESVKRLALRLADLASDTLAFSRLERNEIDLTPGTVDLDAMARETADLFADQRRVTVTTAGDPAVRGDQNRLRQVLYNLIENAIKYSTDGEPVDVSVTGSPEHVRVQVVDRGIGIPGEELSSVFGRFSRATNARKLQIAGTGFGLYLARQIVELHGGTISVQSAEAEGSTFTVDLPRRGTSLQEAPVFVAVLEAQRESRSFIAHALREAGLRVVTCHSVDELLHRLELESIDRLVVDYDEIALSADQTAALETAQEHYGFAIVQIEKPFLVQDLVNAIRSRPE